MAFVILGIAPQGHSQLDNIEISEEIKLQKVYAGFDAKLTTPNDSLYPLAMNSMRLGCALDWSLTNKVSAYAHGAIEGANTHKSFAIAAFVLNVKLTQELQLGVGLPPKATTYTRAHPITWKSQTESYSQSRIPGNKPGLIVQYSLTNKLRLAHSLQNLDGRSWSNHFNITNGQFSLAGFLHEGNEFFVSTRLNTDKIDINYNYSSLRKENTTSIFLNMTEKIAVYGDVNYFTDCQKTSVTNFGIRRYFENKSYHTGGFLSISHDLAKRNTAIQLFLYLK